MTIAGAGHAAKQVALWKPVVTALVIGAAWFAGQSGWVTLGPGDRIDRLESAQNAQAVELDLHAAQLDTVGSSLAFFAELLCRPVINSRAISPGDQMLQNRCRLVIGRDP